jgi:hypothetical protein
MQITMIKTRCQSALRGLFLNASTNYVPAASMSGLFLTLTAVLAASLGAWRLGVDPGWTGSFCVTSGLLSRYQSWFAVAIVAQTSAFVLNRWVAKQVIALPAMAT